MWILFYWHFQGPEKGTLEFAVKSEGKYPYLYDNASQTWTTRSRARKRAHVGMHTCMRTE